MARHLPSLPRHESGSDSGRGASLARSRTGSVRIAPGSALARTPLLTLQEHEGTTILKFLTKRNSSPVYRWNKRIAASALVEDEDLVLFGVPLTAMVGARSATGSAVKHHGRLAVRIAGQLPVEAVAVAHVEVPDG